MTEHKNAVEQLVLEAREFISAHHAHQDEDNMLTYLITIVAIGAVAYAMIN